MSESNAEVVRKAWAALTARDLDAWLDHFDDDVDYVPVNLWPDARPRKGKAALRHFMEGFLADWAEGEWDAELREVIGSGARVLARTRIRSRGGRSGIELSGRTFHVFELSDGRIVRQEDFLERDDAYRAAGLEP